MTRETRILYTNARVMQWLGYYEYSFKEINKCLALSSQELLAILFKSKLLQMFGKYEESSILQFYQY